MHLHPLARQPRSHPFPTLLALLLLGPFGCSDRALHPFFLADAAHRRPFIFAHRGGGGSLGPEEALPTLLQAQKNDPLAVVEFDLHRSRDGHLIVIHDDTVDRTTAAHGRVEDFTLAELQALDAGYCFRPGKGDGTAEGADCSAGNPADFPRRGKGDHLAALEEVLAALPADAWVSIEVKTSGIEQQFADVARASGRMDRMITGSEDDDVAVRLKDLLPELPHYLPRGAATCLALAAKLHLDYPDCPQYQAFASPTEGAGLALDTRGVLDMAHANGVVVIYWTINDEPEMERLLRLGADGLFTDYPDIARKVVDRLRAEGALP
jgi:glycerophosphoryl diester phosphodiesterase